MSSPGRYLRDPFTGLYVRDTRTTIHGGADNPNFNKYLREDDIDPDGDGDPGSGNDCIGCGCRKDIDCDFGDDMPGWINLFAVWTDACGCTSFDTDTSVPHVLTVTSYIQFLDHTQFLGRGHPFRVSRIPSYGCAGSAAPPDTGCAGIWECVRDLSCLTDYKFFRTYVDDGGALHHCEDQITDLPYDVQFVIGIQMNKPSPCGQFDTTHWNGSIWCGIRRKTDPEAIPVLGGGCQRYMRARMGFAFNLTGGDGSFDLDDPNHWNRTTIYDTAFTGADTCLGPGNALMTRPFVLATACGNS